jgi:hypothetical protein
MSPAAYLRASSAAPAQFCAKTGFPSRAEARKQIQKKRGAAITEVAASAATGPLYVYRCSACQCFHLAHKVTRKMR